MNNSNKAARPLILISNDDGYNFPGIKTLTRVARKLGDVVVAAPLEHQSGKASAITVVQPLRAFLRHDEPGYKEWVINGTPTDCVKLALDQLLEGRMPQLVLSGINHGYNTGVSVLYSGTMGACFEGCVHQVPSVAFSYGNYSFDADTSCCEQVIEQVISRVLAQGLPGNVCLNVNIPLLPQGQRLKGIKVTRAAAGRWVNEYERRTDPHGLPYYWLTGNYEPDADPDNDVRWVKEGWVTVTPCQVDQTAHQMLDKITALMS